MQGGGGAKKSVSNSSSVADGEREGIDHDRLVLAANIFIPLSGPEGAIREDEK